MQARRVITTIGGVLFALFLAPPVGQFVVELFRTWGFYDDPLQKLEAGLAWLWAFVTRPWFVGLAGLSVGLTAGVWLEPYLRYREQLSVLDRYRRGVDPLSAFDRWKRRALIRALRKINRGDYSACFHISHVVDLPFVCALASCFRRAGWRTRINERPRPIPPGMTTDRIRIQGFNDGLVSLVRTSLSRAGIDTKADCKKTSKVSRNSAFWQRIDRRIHIWICKP